MRHMFIPALALAMAFTGCAMHHDPETGKTGYTVALAPGPAGLAVLDHGVQVAEEIAAGGNACSEPLSVSVSTRQGSTSVHCGYAVPTLGAGGQYIDPRYAAAIDASARREAAAQGSSPALPSLQPGDTVSVPTMRGQIPVGTAVVECPEDRDPATLEEKQACDRQDINTLFDQHKSQ
jgi:hypothetical protein